MALLLGDRMKGFSILLVISALAAGIQAASLSPQERPTPPLERLCPTLTVNAPDNVNESSSFFFTANVAGGDPNVTPNYNWSISAGTISKGQGTSTIEVTTNGLGTQTITATVEIGGFSGTCAKSNSASTYIVKRPEAKKFDEYGPVTISAANVKLDNFAIELQNNPGAQGYILGYGGRRTRLSSGKKLADAAKTYLVKIRNMDAAGLVTVDGGYKEEVSTELWVVPSGANPPTASPTVDPSEIEPTDPARKPPARRGKKTN